MSVAPAAYAAGSKIKIETISDVIGFDDYYGYSEGHFLLAKGEEEKRMYCVVDTDGNVVIPYKFPFLAKFNNGLARANMTSQNGLRRGDVAGKMGYIDIAGNVAIDFRYDDAWPFDACGYAKVGMLKPGSEYELRYGLIDKAGREMLPFKYDELAIFEGYIYAKIKGEVDELYDLDLNLIQSFTVDEYDRVGSVSDGLRFVEKHVQGQGNNFSGYVDLDGNVVIPLSDKYYNVFDFHEGLAVVQTKLEGPNQDYGYIDKSGNEVIPALYYYTSHFYNGFGMVRIDDRFGFVDKSGKVVIPITYEKIWSFTDGRANMFQSTVLEYTDSKGKSQWASFSQFGFMDAAGKIHFYPILERDESYHTTVCESNRDDVAVVYHDRTKYLDGTKRGLVDADMNELIPLEYDDIQTYKGVDLVKVTIGDKYGVFDMRGNQLLPTEYDAIHISDGTNHFIVEKGSKATLLRAAGAAFDDEATPAAVALQPKKAASAATGAGSGTGSASSPAAGTATGTPSTGASATTAGVSAADTREASPTSSAVMVNNKQVTFEAYNIDGYNYFKLRDVAMALSGSAGQFEVGWDEAANRITITSGSAYTAVGGELSNAGAGTAAEKIQASPTASQIYLDGAEIQLTAYNINGNNFFKLRDIGQALGFEVDWDNAADTVIVNS